MGARTTPAVDDPDAAQLAEAYAALADVLEGVDLEQRGPLASELITALSAVDRAYAIETESTDDGPPRPSQSSAGD